MFPKVQYTKILELMYLAAMDCTVQQIVAMAHVSKHTVHTVQDMLHGVMGACNAEWRIKVRGVVEVDETLWGSAQKGVHGKPSRCKGAFWAAWERSSGAFIIEPMEWMPKFYKMKGAAPARAVMPFVLKWVEGGSIIFTDGLRAYLRLKKLNYRHAYVRHDQGEWVAEKEVFGEQVHTQGVDGMWGHLKTWLRTRRGVRRGKLPGYVACFEWRSRTKHVNRFTTLLQGVVKHWPAILDQGCEDMDEDSEGSLDVEFGRMELDEDEDDE